MDGPEQVSLRQANTIYLPSSWVYPVCFSSNWAFCCIDFSKILKLYRTPGLKAPREEKSRIFNKTQWHHLRWKNGQPMSEPFPSSLFLKNLSVFTPLLLPSFWQTSESAMLWWPWCYLESSIETAIYSGTRTLSLPLSMCIELVQNQAGLTNCSNTVFDIKCPYSICLLSFH